MFAKQNLNNLEIYKTSLKYESKISYAKIKFNYYQSDWHSDWWSGAIKYIMVILIIVLIIIAGIITWGVAFGTAPYGFGFVSTMLLEAPSVGLTAGGSLCVGAAIFTYAAIATAIEICNEVYNFSIFFLSNILSCNSSCCKGNFVFRKFYFNLLD